MKKSENKFKYIKIYELFVIFHEKSSKYMSFWWFLMIFQEKMTKIKENQGNRRKMKETKEIIYFHEKKNIKTKVVQFLSAIMTRHFSGPESGNFRAGPGRHPVTPTPDRHSF